MKTQALLLTALLASAGAAFAADIQTTPYAYDMKLDVAEVISVEEAPHGRCEPVNTKMTYRDSKGATHTVSYVKQDAGCY